MLVVGLFQSLHNQSQHTTSRRTTEASYPGDTKFSSGSYSRQFREESSSDRQMQSDEGTTSTHVSRKIRHDRRSHLSDAMQAQLGPQAPSVEGQSHMLETLRVHLGPPVAAPLQEQSSQPLRQQTEVPPTPTPLDSISQQLDDMLSMLFSPHVINYKSPKGFIVPKSTMYNGASDLFDHIMHFRQLMTLDIGIDALMCKVFPANLHSPAL